jgi:transcription-repair coupling factor (superfamily II helicase)
LGAGLSIAMRDLEIRGTGDILGTRQHGHIAAVGFHLYTSLLAEAVRRIRQEKGFTSTPLPPSINIQLNPVNIELPFSSGIPVEYVPERDIRLGLYRRVADMRSFRELESLQEEFEERFGAPPEELQNLFFQLKIKLLAEQAGLTSVMLESGQLAFRYSSDELPSWIPPKIPGLRVGKTALWFQYKNSTDWKDRLIALLNNLKEYQNASIEENITIKG